MKHFLSVSLIVSAIGLANTLHAATPKGTIRLEAGTEYDSNLSVIELDQFSTQSDWAAVLNARLNGRWKATDKLELKGGYSYLSKTYQDYDDFDLAIQQLFADVSYQFEPVTIGASFHNADAELADKDLLTLQQTSFYASRLFNQRVFVRGAVNFQDKDFPSNGERNARNTGFAGDVFVFFNQGATFIATGVTQEQEDANQASFDYDATSLRASINHKFSVWGKNSKVQLGTRYHARDYSDITSAVNSRRADTHRVTNIEWEINLTENIIATSKIERGNYESNFAAADYSETLGSIIFAVTF
ncbi:hypothetical protein [Cellvibrio sp. OA-2007]|uniref:hypothetical protein n=1 Tax=Cellvibrio sp. OA-2007 TaxID=529823 RepID=UPI00078581E2|nr:hypothetical protein [Cellvibrio sp. OA-2007]